jgi:aspartyl-tRNA(Asn)/glutamyl-tRNA(Gln) amidotransferase subunit C
MINTAELKQIAHLAKLSIDELALDETVLALNNILKLAEDLNEVDTQSITPMAHPLKMVQRLRADEVLEKDQSNQFQAIAPQTSNSHYLVPTVIE